MLHRAEK